MTEMTAADQRLDDLVAKMNSASGPAKVEATAAAVTELVTERKAMHERMMKMHHQRTMGHMMEHMSIRKRAGGKPLEAAASAQRGGERKGAHRAWE